MTLRDHAIQALDKGEPVSSSSLAKYSDAGSRSAQVNSARRVLEALEKEGYATSRLEMVQFGKTPMSRTRTRMYRKKEAA